MTREVALTAGLRLEILQLDAAGPPPGLGEVGILGWLSACLVRHLGDQEIREICHRGLLFVVGLFRIPFDGMIDRTTGMDDGPAQEIIFRFGGGGDEFDERDLVVEYFLRGPDMELEIAGRLVGVLPISLSLRELAVGQGPYRIGRIDLQVVQIKRIRLRAAGADSQETLAVRSLR